MEHVPPATAAAPCAGQPWQATPLQVVFGGVRGGIYQAAEPQLDFSESEDSFVAGETGVVAGAAL